MKVRTASCRRESIYDFYTEMTNNEQKRHGGTQMLSLLARLEGLADLVPMWALTSHARLLLHSADIMSASMRGKAEAEESCIVTIAALAHGFWVEWGMKEKEAPWPHARIEAEAPDVEGAYRLILTAMRQIGWPSIDQVPAPPLDGLGDMGPATFETTLFRRHNAWTPAVRLGESTSLTDMYRRMAEGLDPPPPPVDGVTARLRRETGEQGMLLLSKLEPLAREVPVWGTTIDTPARTRGFELMLLSDETRFESRYVSVIVFSFQKFSVGYRMTDEDAPWPRAEVHTGSFGDSEMDETCRRIRIGMRRCGGWPALPEVGAQKV